MKLAYAGTTSLAVGVLAGLAAGSHEIVGVLTTPDKPRGRHGGFAEMIFVVTACVAIGRDALADILRV